MADEGWKSSFRKRHRTLFTKAHKLQGQAPENIRIHIVVQRVDDNEATMFCWNSHPNESTWPPTRDEMTQSSCKTMTPEDMQRDAQRRSRARKKKTRTQPAPQASDETASESSEIEILFETPEYETGLAQDEVGRDDVDMFDSSDMMLGSGWHGFYNLSDSWHTPPLHPQGGVASPAMMSGLSTAKREASSPVDATRRKTPRRDEMVSEIRSTPDTQAGGRPVVGGLRPLVFPTSPL